MKFFIIVILLLFTACSANEKTKTERMNTAIEDKRSVSYPFVTEKEITLGEAVTDIIDKGSNRVANISLACNKITGKEILPDEIFSFNTITGEKTSVNGYKMAPVILQGEKAYDIGGGVCQVSTTVYQAVVNAGLEIIEQHCHSEPVAYAAKGTDATVVFGVKDFRFKNNSNETVYVYTWVEQQKVFAKIIKKSIDILQ